MIEIPYVGYKMVTSKFKPPVTILMLILISGCGVAGVREKNEAPPDVPEIVICNSDTDTFCLEGDKDKAARLNRQGLEWAAKQDYDQALDLFKTAIELDNSKPEYHYNLGLNYYYKGMLKEEEASYLKVLAIEPNDPVLNPALAKTYFGLACVYAEQGKKDEAFAQLEKLLSIDPTMLYHSIRDKDLDGLRDDPRFERFLPKKPGNTGESENKNSDEFGKFQ